MSDLLTARPYFVYRIFDKNDQLLYIGSTREVEYRISMHTQSSIAQPSSWEIAERMSYQTVQEYPDKAQATIAEKQAIKSEMPLFNREHNPLRFKRVKGRYLAIENVLTASEGANK